ncbi:uncharacterized protein FIBRA_00221 [Fibroporia radiculosa]|uniref:C2H2-type domain-containing protein n=1 Tax=Fibroporia radiculosa TaxID=599839 RepID=J7RGN0_9APHY|nr:uncharacterized protein FIBRA_00221 [Fibroporia radiculosa]CCL98227.1 predicted protein [Fibroporia radiculosa]
MAQHPPSLKTSAIATSPLQPYISSSPMFREHPMASPWHRHDSASSAPLAYPDDFSQSFPQSLQRYPHFASYHASNTPSSGVSHSLPASRHPWAFDAQDQQLQYTDPPTAAYCETTQAMPSSYYANPSQLVGYPESSQRTLLQESAYAGAYSLSYHDPAMQFDELVSSTVSAPAGHLGIDTTHSIRHRARLEQGEADRRAPYVANNQYIAASADFEPSAATHRLVSQSTPNMHSLVNVPHSSSSMHSILSSHHLASSPSSLSHTISGLSALTDAQSPRLASSYGVQLRRNSMESVHDPLSPSAVPSLIYDADTGDDGDDDSESSPPSAISELSRPAYQPSGRHDRLAMDINSPGDWPRSSFDAAYSIASAQESDRATRQPARSPKLSAESASFPAVSPSSGSPERSKPAQKKSKMHQCSVCSKLFPRPSGLATHMNSHSGAKPYKCPIPTCTKSFAVRSNAKRHLRTHGIVPTPDHANTSPSQFTVGFETPLVSEVHDVGKLPHKLRWVPQSLSTRTNADYLRDSPSDSEEEYMRPSCPLLPVPLPPVTPSSPTWNPDDGYEERNSYGEAGPSPYIPSQWRGLPGPVMSSNTF